jgi:hypothetical protein
MTEEEIISAGREGLVVKNKDLSTALKQREEHGKVRGRLALRRQDGQTVLVDFNSNVFADSEGNTRTITIMREA